VTLSTPVAIVVGLSIAGAFVGTGLYLGLRSSRGASGASEARVIEGMPSRSVGSDAVPASSGTVTAALLADAKSAREKAFADARRGLELEHAKLVRDCWESSPAAAGATAPVVLTLTLGYGEDGHVTTRALRANGTNVPGDVAGCVNREVTGPDIPAPGVRTRVEVEIRFP
jgi:hypothetical protein